MSTQRTTKTDRPRIATALWVIALLVGLVTAFLAQPGIVRW